MTLEDFKNKRITVMGIGLHGGGVGVIKFMVAQGAKVLATDLRKKEELAESLQKLEGLDVEYVFGKHRTEDFTSADMVIKNPGVPEDSEFLKAAHEAKVPIENDIGIFLELCPASIIGVTGTKGKSTTASLLAHIMREHFPQVILAGNIRQSVLEKLPEITKDTIVVLELSSWMLSDAREHKISPYVGVITNILEDHMNRYNNFQDYIIDKKLIYRFQKEKDYLFLNYSDPILRDLAKEAPSRIYFYSDEGEKLFIEDLPKLSQKARIGAYLKGKKIYYGAAQEEICRLSDIKLLGRHNLQNVLAAVSVADLYNVPRKTIKAAIKSFKGLNGRMQFINEVDKKIYINDTAATAPDAAIAAVNSIFEVKKKDKNIILISGGADKELDFTEFGKIISEKCKAVILLEGTATQKIKDSLNPELKTEPASNMEQAVKIATRLAQPGDIVILSPGCASFGLFKHEFDRGDKFNQAVESLKS